MLKITILCLLFATVGRGQSVGLSLSNVKQTPQYSQLKIKNYELKTAAQTVVQSAKPQAVPLAFSIESLPFFCKIEYKMGLNAKFPLKFRLGDVQMVDELEGKKH